MFRKILSGVFGLILALTAAGIAAAQSSYSIRPGDTLSIEVLEDSTLNRKVLVLPDGSVTFPMAGTIPAAGRSPEQLRQTLIARLTPNFATAPSVYVAVSDIPKPETGAGGSAALKEATQSVYVMGEVNKPGLLEVKPGTTLLQALAVSGGFSKFAATKRIQLHRTDAKSWRTTIYGFDFTRPAGGGATIGGATVLAPGDVIVIPQRHLFE